VTSWRSSIAGLSARVSRRAWPVRRSATKMSAGEVSEATVKAIIVSSRLKRTPPRSPSGTPRSVTGRPLRVSVMVSRVEPSALTAATR
jgi:hypothetical protein